MAERTPKTPLERLQLLSERDFVERILVPLCEKLFAQVEVRHGPHEKGIDILCFRDGPLGGQELIGIQAKKLRLSGRVSTPKHLYSVLPQLEQALTEPVLLATGKRHRLSKIYLATPYPIPDGILENAFARYEEHVRRGMQVLPGPQILALVKEAAPHLLAELGDRSFEYLHRLKTEVLVSREAAVLGLLGQRAAATFHVEPTLAATFPVSGALFAGGVRPRARRVLRVDEEGSDHWSEFAGAIAAISPAAVRCERKSVGLAKTIEVSLDGQRFAKDLIAEHKRTSDALALARKNAPADTGNALANLLRFRARTEELVRRRESEELVEKLGGTYSQHVAVNVAAHELVDARMSFQVIGDAGMGKTTLLRDLCQRAANDRSRLPVFVSLAQMTPRQTLLGFISGTLARLGYRHSRTSLAELLRSGTALLALDGIDEAAARVPQIHTEIRALLSEYEALQVIASTRPWARLETGPLMLDVVVRPLNDEQVKTFFTRWFSDNVEASAEVLAHIANHPDLRRPISTPLVAVLLAVVRSRGGRLPTSLPEVYDRRLDLFLSDWDSARGVHRNRFDARDKRLFLRKLAYEAHERRVRGLSRSVVLHRATSCLGRIAPQDAEAFVDEIIRHNNLLFEEPGGDIGFGHLQYQEHLVALEARENRMVDLASKLGDEWWSAALEIYAQITTDVSAIIDAAVRKKAVEQHTLQLGQLIGLAPNTEKGLRILVERMLEQDSAVAESFSKMPPEVIVSRPPILRRKRETRLRK
jgi:hypothetical protein